MTRILSRVYGMIMADRKIESKEKKLIELIETAFGLSEKQYQDIITVADELRNVYDKIYEVLF